VDLVEDGPNLLVTSSAGGGKTTLLIAWVLALAEFNSPEQVQFVIVSGRRNSLKPLAHIPHILDFCRTPDRLCEDGVLTRLLAEIRRRDALFSDGHSISSGMSRIVVMFDDYEDFYSEVGAQQAVQDKLTVLAKRGRTLGIHAIASGPLPDVGGIVFRDPLIKQIRNGRSGFILKMVDPQNPLGLQVRPSDIKPVPPGRGYLVRGGSEVMLQVATPGDAAAVAGRVTRLQERWQSAGCPSANWPEETLAMTEEAGEEKPAAT
jgi:S-DNA-T family DNA segregation ATPase FtsK/SpoIIIE